MIENMPQRPIRVGVLSLTGGGMSGGYVKYVGQLVPRIAADAGVEAVLFIALPTTIVPMDTSIAPGKLTTAVVPRFYRRFTRAFTAGTTALMDEFAPDVVLIPNSRYVLNNSWPLVVVSHNMEPLVWDDRLDPWRQRVINRARRAEAWLATRRATRVVAVSDFVRTFLLERWRIPAPKVAVVYHGIVGERGSTRPPSLPDLPAGFYFTAGATRPSRGLEDVIEAVRLEAPKSGRRLVVAGRADAAFRGYESRLRSTAGAHTIWLGELSNQEMAWCFRHSIAFVMTSRVEACPNIALEAMAEGAIIVAADNRPLPEIFGDAAVGLYPPRDPVALSKLLVTVAGLSPEARRDGAVRAVTRATTFDWSRSAASTVAVLKDASAAKRRRSAHA